MGRASPAKFPRDPSFVLLGLGNPGSRYSRTRHNFGFLVAEALAKNERLSFVEGAGPFVMACGEIEGGFGIVAKPTTYMNRSGEAAQALRTLVPRLPLERFLVMSDDLDLPFGKIRLRARGGAGGHNGLRSIISVWGTQDFPRLRLGIGRPPAEHTTEIVDWVLEKFSPEEFVALQSAVDAALLAVRSFLREDLERAMSRVNGGVAEPPAGRGEAGPE